MQALLEKYKKSRVKPLNGSSQNSLKLNKTTNSGATAPKTEEDKPKHFMFEIFTKIQNELDCTESKEGLVKDWSTQLVKPEAMAILILIIDELPHEAIWRLWLDQADAQSRARVKFHFHAKFPDKVQSPWVRERLVEFSFKPNWASVEITKAMLALLRRCVREDASEEIGKFAFASESCVPIVPLEECLERVFADDRSWMRLKSTANNGYAQNMQFGPLKNKVPDGCALKADQWILLNRRHALVLLRLPSLIAKHLPNDDTQQHHQQQQHARLVPGMDPEHWAAEKRLFSLFSGVRASDEMFIPTCLAVLKEIDGAAVTQATGDLEPHSVALRSLTYCDWDDNPTNPTTFHALTTGDAVTRVALQKARESRSVFFRKLKRDPQRSMPDVSTLLHGRERNPNEHIGIEWLSVVYPEADATSAVAFMRGVYEELKNAPRRESRAVGQKRHR